MPFVRIDLVRGRDKAVLMRLGEEVAKGVADTVGNAGGRLFALDDTCLHRGGSLACGHLDGEVLVCPMHWWRYDVRSGRRLGRPVLLTPFERRRALERSLGVPERTFDWRGPFDPAADPRWRAMQAGELSERAYWAGRAAEVAAVSGEAGVPAMMARLFDGPEDELVRPQARALVAGAKAAGLETAVLTNDLYVFHAQAWIDRMRVLAEVGCVVDTSRHGTRKPEPAAYRLVLDRLGVAADQAVFVDDQPANAAGAGAAGMAPVWFDVTRPDDSYQQVRQAIGLGGAPGGNP